MEIKPTSMQSFLTSCYLNIFLNIKEVSITSKGFFYLLFFLEANQIFLMLDIIFNCCRTSLNIYFPFYFISPVFLIEYYISLTSTGQPCMAEAQEGIDTSTDQISLILTQVLKIEKYSPYCVNDGLYHIMIGTVSIVLLCVFILSFKIKRFWILFLLGKFASAILCICLKVFLHCILFMLMKIIFSQGFIPLHSSSLDISYFAIIFIFLFFLFLSSQFYFYFFSCYKTEEFIFDIWESNNINTLRSEFSISLINSFLLNVRLFPHISLFFKTVALAILILLFYFYYSNYVTSLVKGHFKIIKLAMNLFFFSLMLIKILDLFFIWSNDDYTLILRIFEIISAVLISILLWIIISRHRKIFQLQDILNYVKVKDERCCIGIHQLYSELGLYFEFLLQKGKIKNLDLKLNKAKQLFVKKMKYELINNFLGKDDDFGYISQNTDDTAPPSFSMPEMPIQNEDDNKIFLHTVSLKETTSTDFKKMLAILLLFAGHIKQSLAINRLEVTNEHRLSELLILIKIVMYYCYDEQPFRAQFFIKKFLTSSHFSKCSWKCYSLLQFLENKLSILDHSEDNHWIWTITVLELNQQYLQIISCFESILSNFRDVHIKGKFRMIDEKSEMIGQSYTNILKNGEETENCKVKDQTAVYRYKLSNDILFNVKDYAKLFDSYDIPTIDASVDRNSFFILLYHDHTLVIKKLPTNYYKITGNKSKPLLDHNFDSFFPQEIKRPVMQNIKKNITYQSQPNFVIESAILGREKYIFGVKLSFTVLPVIGNQIYIICHLDADSKIRNNYALISENGTAVHIGLFFKNYFGITSHMRSFDIFRLMNMKNVYHEEKQVRKRQSKKKVGFSKTVPSSIEICIDLEQYEGNYINATRMDETVIDDKSEQVHLCNLQMISKLQNGKVYYSDTRQTVFLSMKEICDYARKNTNEKFHLVEFQFKDWQNHNCEEDKVKNTDNESLTKNQLDIFLLLPGNTFSVTSSTITSLSSNDKVSINRGFHRKAEEKNIKSITDLMILIYNLLLLLIAIGGLVFIEISSQNLINVFTALKTLRRISFQYFDEQFHVTNVIILNNYSKSNSLENELKANDSTINFTFANLYQENFQNMTNDFFPLYLDLKNNFSKYVDSEFTDKMININASVIQLDGLYYPDKFFSVLNNPKNTFYIISKFAGYSRSVPFLDTRKPYGDQFRVMNDAQKQLYKGCFNFRVLREALLKVNSNMVEYLESTFQSYQIKIQMTFLVFIFLHLLTFILYVYDSRIYYNKIVKIAENIFNITGIEFLKKKLKKVKRLIEMEEKAADVITYLKHEIKKIGDHVKQEDLKQSILVSSADAGLVHFDSRHNHDEYSDRSSKENCVIRNSDSSGREKYSLHSYNFAIRVIIVINMVYIVFSVISFPLISYFITRIKISQTINENIYEIHKNLLHLYLGTRYSILLNDTVYPYETGILNQNPISIYNHFNHLIKLVQNEPNLISFKEFLLTLQTTNACRILLNRNKYYSGLRKVCNQITVLQESFYTVISYFVNQVRNNYLEYMSSSKTVEKIMSFYHSKDIQEISLTNLIYIMNIMKEAKDTYGMPIYTNDISNLVDFCVVMFVIMVMTEFVNFFMIRVQVVKKLQKTMQNFLIMEKFFTNNDMI